MAKWQQKYRVDWDATVTAEMEEPSKQCGKFWMDMERFKYQVAVKSSGSSRHRPLERVEVFRAWCCGLGRRISASQGRYYECVSGYTSSTRGECSLKDV